ncbi:MULTISPECIES: response regulator transcription factor [Psychrobacter]|mgnify:FL=1|jgi:two-component system response regulator CpxR|uniref:Response regulator transcription factor n=1 Tax=Psychrobacter faecalis TaxID=180588 RepID=A0ABT9HI76_9GAMM|nr:MULTISPECIES: response regulator transcription factor [Psychrobacter]MBK3392937.1 response regulator transcription factor [Psychrobacter sp. M9-54-1]MDN5694309.1 response regulator transcription factor [Psychrobacter sp.]MDP4545428.1 response regulator transcription factor [Psychrobacter faecalis]PKG86685.1 DNA-binding response regulator [Psychrobacter sp. Sarcosine-02u-2]WLW65281.1 response regulator transcription factor [Psychrobacter sp. van23A]
MANILLGDDDEELTQLLQEYLHNHGIQSDCVHDGEAVIERLKSAMHDSAPYDLLVLDIMMPKIDGLSVLRQLPAISDIPVIMLTAKGEEIDRIIGLELGADDYITKPCNPRELLARINAVIKRSRITASGAAASEHLPLPESRLHLDQNQRLCQIDGVELQVTGTEFDLLVALLKQKGEVVSKAWLSQHVLQRELQPFDRSLDVHVSRLRKKLQPFHDEPIKAIRGKGYQLVL